MTLRHTTIGTAVGDLLVVADGDAVTGVYFPGHWYPPASDRIGTALAIENAGAEASDPVFTQVERELDEYFAGRRTHFEVVIATSGDAFQEQVWRMLRAITFGATTTYGALAEALGDRALARRVGQAVGRNPVSILIPCHRVVGADGSLTGYAGGLERKRVLLELEGAEVVAQSRLF
ncbi:methylated-DNA--[protein]-cysteine S-methyltransferase [Agromyces protaetiae]|uniref:Methylated-DNA--protein-cysteine methyltransferase n=1 Tax=Agromyces protaetiae TaxID=2509455 RepID=A0A4P6FF31_9MICO|nr:methylated-DNA--[protein]-cysteine S-methyltransferase [Agromyces protaetiae]QAY72999.1 methylated-DNA--[protein]-cysteine S-methyltransferase [Agromyces protaetiae]